MAKASILRSYLALLVIIVLWVAVWAVADSIGKLYLQDHKSRVKFYLAAAILASMVLIIFFPNEMRL